MPLHSAIHASSLAPGIWESKLEPDEVGQLGSPLNRGGQVSIIGLQDAAWKDGFVLFDPAQAVVLNEGATDRTLLIEFARPKAIAERATRVRAIQSEILHRAGATGDMAFLRDCDQRLPPDVAATAHKLVGELRSFSPGELVEGKAHKWVNSPDNFVAITGQNQDRSLAITVRGSPYKHPHPNLGLKPDRTGYSRFKIRAVDQVSDAITIIRRAHDL